MDDETARRLGQLEDEGREHAVAIADLQTVVMGPPPGRSNGIRGELHELKKQFYAHKEAALLEGTEVAVANIQAGATKGAATWQAWAAMITSFLTFLGVVAALIWR